MHLRVTLVLILLIMPSIFKTQEDNINFGEITYSVCTPNLEMGLCVNGFLETSCGVEALLNKGNTSSFMASVRGFHVFLSQTKDADGLIYGEFMFQDTIGFYKLLNPNLWGNLACVIRYGEIGNHQMPALTLVPALELLSETKLTLFESYGTPSECIDKSETWKSLVINGNESWQLFGRNGMSVCIQAFDLESFIPGIVKDVRAIGFDLEDNTICRVVRGCSKNSSDIIFIPNADISGILQKEL